MTSNIQKHPHKWFNFHSAMLVKNKILTCNFGKRIGDANKVTQFKYSSGSLTSPVWYYSNRNNACEPEIERSLIRPSQHRTLGCDILISPLIFRQCENQQNPTYFLFLHVLLRSESLVCKCGTCVMVQIPFNCSKYNINRSWLLQPHRRFIH